MQITSVFIIFVILLETSYQQCLSTFDMGTPRSRTMVNVYNGEQKFAFDLLTTINQLKPNRSIFFSPYSAYHTLLITFFLVDGNAETQLRKILKIDDSLTKVDLFAAYKLEKFSRSNITYEFVDANSIFVADHIRVRECILDLFERELVKVPFKTDTYGSVDAINKWVENSTQNVIKELLVPETIDQSTTLVLISAAYFKGKWEKKFNPRNTKQENFYISLIKSVQVEMMEVEGTFNYEENEAAGAHLLEIPYEGKKTSMYVFMPVSTTEDDIFEKLKLEKLQTIINEGISKKEKIRLKFPKFSVEQTIELKPVFDLLALGEMFKDSANFSTLSTLDNVVVNKVFHKSTLVVSEEGTSGKESVEFVWRFADEVMEEPINFSCNRPFVYVIYQKLTRTVLFAGIFRGPV